jgi:hypothetical protein
MAREAYLLALCRSCQFWEAYGKLGSPKWRPRPRPPGALEDEQPGLKGLVRRFQTHHRQIYQRSRASYCGLSPACIESGPDRMALGS